MPQWIREVVLLFFWFFFWCWWPTHFLWIACLCFHVKSGPLRKVVGFSTLMTLMACACSGVKVCVQSVMICGGNLCQFLARYMMYLFVNLFVHEHGIEHPIVFDVYVCAQCKMNHWLDLFWHVKCEKDPEPVPIARGLMLVGRSWVSWMWIAMKSQNVELEPIIPGVWVAVDPVSMQFLLIKTLCVRLVHLKCFSLLMGVQSCWLSQKGRTLSGSTFCVSQVTCCAWGKLIQRLHSI